MVWLVVLWQLLWRDVSFANIVGGLVLAAVVTVVRPGQERLAPGHTVRPLQLLIFLAYFAWLLVVSNLVVAREIVTRRDYIRSGIVAVPVAVTSELVTTVLADAITLTPGTLSLEVRQKLQSTRPRTIGHAGRIDGITPAALTLLAAHVRRGRGRKAPGAGPPLGRPRSAACRPS